MVRLLIPATILAFAIWTSVGVGWVRHFGKPRRRTRPSRSKAEPLPKSIEAYCEVSMPEGGNYLSAQVFNRPFIPPLTALTRTYVLHLKASSAEMFCMIIRCICSSSSSWFPYQNVIALSSLRLHQIPMLKS